MTTRISRICDAIIEAGWLAALVVAPLFFNTFSNRVFEPDKIHLVRSIALLMVVAWLVQLLDGAGGPAAQEESLWQRLRKTPLLAPVLALVVSYLLSTALSVIPRSSFFGSYVRMQGTFSFLSYAVIFALVLMRLRRRDQVNRLLHTIVLTSLPIAIYGIIQNSGLDPLPWGGDVRERVAANMGNAIFVAAYLIMAVFITLERLLDSAIAMLNAEQGSLGDAARTGAYLFVLAVQLIAIVFTQSRGPWLGLGAGLYVFVMLGLLLLARWAIGRQRLPAAIGWLSRYVRGAWLTLIGLTVAGLALLVVLNLPAGPLQGLCDTRYVSRLCTLFSTSDGTNAVRALIWEGVVDMMLKPHAPIATPDGQPDPLNIVRPLIGYGPESMWVAYNRFYPPDLAHYEARNASPDRSHNETFDTLVRGGLFQFGAQIALFSSVFYHALRWLGLMRGAGRRKLFVALLIAGGVVGVIVPLIADGSLRLAGIGLPVGLIAGMILYVTLDVLLGNVQPASAEPISRAEGRRQWLVLALLSAIVAHFVEVHFGIAIVSTMTYLWVMMAVLVVVGMRWDADDALDAGTQPVASAIPAPQPVALPAAKPSAQSSPVTTKTSAVKRKGAKKVRVEERRTPAPAPARVVRSGGATIGPVLPYCVIGGLLTLVLVWNYLVNQSGADGALAVLWNAFTQRPTDYQIVASPILLVMLLFVWFVGGLLALGESSRQARRPGSRFAPAAAVGAYAGTVLGVFLVYGILQANRLDLAGLSGLAVFERFAGHIVAFDVCLLLGLLGLAAGILAANPQPWPVKAFGRSPALSLGGGVIALAAALLIIVNVNIQTVQADTYYKQGLGYEAAGQWEGAVVLYREAALLEPQEDYYYLFLGRALLQLADAAPAGTPTLPDDLSQIATGDLLALVERGVQARNKPDLLRAAQAALTAAQRLNPLNTDHSANLARLQRAWAFADVPGGANQGAVVQLRQIVQSQPEAVDRDRLARSLVYYGHAISLSPQNAVLWNEQATVQIITDNLTEARASLDRSLALDDRYYPTYLLRGDLLELTGDRQGALEAYRAAAQLAPNDLAVLSTLGVFSAQSGDSQGALDAFQRIIEVELRALSVTEGRLNELDALAAQAGGYSRLASSAANQQASLQSQIAGYRAQLHLAYRNTALVLRDAGRFAEALTAAQEAAVYARESELPTIESLIADLQGRLTP